MASNQQLKMVDIAGNFYAPAMVPVNANGDIGVLSLRPPLQVMKTDNGDGRVTGTMAGLAANAVAWVVFDLGVDWAQYGSFAIGYRALTSAGSILQVFGSADGATNDNHELPFATVNGLAYIAGLQNGGAAFLCVPQERYVRVKITNGTTPQSADVTLASVKLTAIPS